MTNLILTAFAKEFEIIQNLLKFPTFLKTTNQTLLEGEILNKKVSLLCMGQGLATPLNQLKISLEKNVIRNVLLVGFAGALTDQTQVGEVFMPHQFVLDPKTPKPAIRFESLALVAEGLGFRTGSMVSVGESLQSAEARAECFRASQCELVDMEAFPIAEFLFFEEMPFYTLKIVLDNPNSKYLSDKTMLNQIADRLAPIVQESLFKLIRVLD